ncbi:hypothetical protein BN844_2253 [Pseudomonas sp. SHC52]|nr:hypothetical protein BN844_2253 [Pseudomonas sp. SHC52]
MFLEMTLALAAQQRRGRRVRALGKLFLGLNPPLPFGVVELLREQLAMFSEAIVTHFKGRR